MENLLQKKSKGLLLMKTMLFAYVITTILLLVLAFLLYKMDLSEGQVNIGIMVIYIVSCFLAGFLLGKNVETRRFVWGALAGVGYFVLLMVVSLTIQQGIAVETSQILTAFGMCVGGGTIGGMLS